MFMLPVTDRSRIAEARRRAVDRAADLGFGESDRATVALVATEIASNLVKHARDGELLVGAMPETGGAALDLLAIDRGPGMADPGACLRDGFSTAGSPGTGLGAIARLSATFDLHTMPGHGTVLLARLRPTAARGGPVRMPARVELGAVCLPLAGEIACGDAWSWRERPDGARLLVVDGLGHGLPAAEAVAAALRTFHADRDRPLAELIDRLHGALRPTRGAAAAVADLDVDGGRLLFAGVGNVAGALVTPEAAEPAIRRTVSHNGTLGHTLRKVQEFAYPCPAGTLVVLYSDGLGSHWRLSDYPGLVARHPALVAGVLYRDHRRGRDDVTVVVARGVQP